MKIPEVVHRLETRAAVRRWRADTAERIGFVPTMGALHEGHLSLIRRARKENPVVIVSIFVNPTQFDDAEDFRRYPRPLDRDLALLEAEAVDAVFIPTVEEMYPEGFDDEDAHYTFGELETILEGAHRPGHFRGVAQVVAKLLRLVQPHVLYLGEKDYQQYLILKRLVREYLRMPVEVVLCPTVREPDGLAYSSRNQLLSREGRRQATCLYRALCRIREGYYRQEPLESVLADAHRIILDTPLVQQVDYLVVADAETLRPIQTWQEAEHAYALGAIRIENVRLIDNLRLY